MPIKCDEIWQLTYDAKEWVDMQSNDITLHGVSQSTNILLR